MLYKVGPKALLYPTSVWIVIVLVLFTAEYAVMLMLPSILPGEPVPVLAALIDSFAITVLVAPIVWWTLVRPMRQVIRFRTQLLGDLFTAVEAERQQTAHELHDGIGQELSLLISGLRSAHELTGNSEQAGRCAELQKLAQNALAEVRRIARGLRPSLLDDFGLVAAISKVVDDFREHANVEIRLQANGLEELSAPDAVKIAIFRIFQEALANVIRHSQAKHAVVELRRDGNFITLSISDDGRGFDSKRFFEQPNVGQHFGMIGMRERAALLGGRFELETAPDRGCRIVVQLPSEETNHVGSTRDAGR